MNDIREKILSGEITVADSAASTPVMIVSKTTLRTWGTDTKQFRFYPYRKLTDDEITAFLFAEIRTGSVDPESLRTSALLSAIMCNKSLLEAIEFAGTFVRDAMIITREQPDFEVRGVSFEGVLKELTDLL